jgi:arabinose-5-phosphate isomerase
MTEAPKTISRDALVDDALRMFEEHKITALFVVAEHASGNKPVGVLHIHDCALAR